MKLDGSRFYGRVWKAMRRIPRGKVTTYGELAHALHTHAYRAVGGACRHNPYAPQVPCHRVVAAGGRIGGFGGQTKGKSIREKIFHLTHQEVPYACAVRVEELSERPECLYIQATLFVEQESQKGIVIGQGGSMLKRIGTAAREDLERFFGIKTYLALRVRVRKNWRKDDHALREFGFLLTS